MKVLLLIVAAAVITGLGFVSVNNSLPGKKIQVSAAGTYTPVAVLELFTSEGCSSCPPADKLLAQIAATDTNIFALSFHVDYWNRLGWTDPFSKKEYSGRQSSYADHFNLESVYTPQLIVNGGYELVGSNKIQATATVQKALNEKSTVALSINAVKVNNSNIQFTVNASGDFKNTNLIAAYVLRNATEKINAGENQGKILSHINVVRALSTIAASSETGFTISLPDRSSAADKFALIVYAQQQGDMKITGAVMYNL